MACRSQRANTAKLDRHTRHPENPCQIKECRTIVRAGSIRISRPEILLIELFCKKMKNPIPPRTVLRLNKLWPNARKQGHEVGEIWRVGYYSKKDGLECIWLVNTEGQYAWTSDHDWLYRKFEILSRSDEDDFYGDNREVLLPLSEEEMRHYANLKTKNAEQGETLQPPLAPLSSTPPVI